MDDWQPIETAPKDGTRILAYIPWKWADGGEGEQLDVIAWDERATMWFSPTAPNYVQGCDSECLPTHWQPLPDPPKPLNLGASVSTNRRTPV
jgi:hypothetical protein